MCGITGAFKARQKIDKAKNTRILGRVIDLYQNQATRGKEGFGAVIVHPDGLTDEIRATEPVNMLVRLHTYGLQGEPEPVGCLFHHRFPTSTQNTLDQTHPIFVSHPDLKHDYYVAHNGCIWNKKSMKATHEKEGYRYSTELTNGKFNDSEICSIEFAQAISDGRHAMRSEGSQALAALALDKDTGKALAVYFGTNGTNPLTMTHDKKSGYLELASELCGEAIKPETLYRFDLETGLLTTRELKFKKEIIKSYTPAGYKTKEKEESTKPKTEDSTVWKGKDHPEKDGTALITAPDQSPTSRDASDFTPDPDFPFEPERSEIDDIIDGFVESIQDPDVRPYVTADWTSKEIRRCLERMHKMADVETYVPPEATAKEVQTALALNPE